MIKQFYDEGLAHSSYIIISNGEAAVVDPTRNPKIYYDTANENNAKIVAVIETHPHADFVSSHLEIHKTTGATIYISKLLGAFYPHQEFDEGASIKIGEYTLKSINTPGHSPDSICIIAEKDGKQEAIFTGDTLFIGDVGRPDLREGVGNMQVAKENLARDMYKSTRTKLMMLQESAMVYPAHGAGSLCGKNLSTEICGSLGQELKNNPNLQPMTEDEFVNELLKDQPWIPKYFGFDVELNRKGADNYSDSINAVPRFEKIEFESNILIIDSRPGDKYKQGFIKGSFNIPNGEKFETWVGSIVNPNEEFYLICDNESEREILIDKLSKIGYEKQVKAAVLNADNMTENIELINIEEFKTNPELFNVLDIRNASEVADRKIFSHSENIPLPFLREQYSNAKLDKPLVVHCKGGYRSSVGTSILYAQLGNGHKIYDLSNAVLDF